MNLSILKKNIGTKIINFVRRHFRKYFSALKNDFSPYISVATAVWVFIVPYCTVLGQACTVPPGTLK